MEELQGLIDYWRAEAKRHEDAAKDCDIGDDEYFLNHQSARVYRICALALQRTMHPADASQSSGIRE